MNVSSRTLSAWRVMSLGHGAQATTLGTQSQYSGDMSSQGDSRDSLSIGSRDSGTVAQGMALRSRSLANVIFMLIRAVPKWRVIDASWKVQAAIMGFEVLPWIMYATHPLLGWEMSYDNEGGIASLHAAWYEWMRRITLFGWPSTVSLGRIKLVFTLLIYLPLALQLLYFIVLFGAVGFGKSTKYVMPGKVLSRAARVLEIILFKIFGVALMGTLLLPVTCNSGRFDTLPDGVALLVFPAPCSQLRPHMVPGVLAFLIQACMYVITAIKDCEMDPFSSRPLAPASPAATLRISLLKVSSVALFHFFFRGSGDVSFIIQALAWFWIAYIHVLRAPYTGFVHPMARSLIAGGLFCAFVAASSQARNQNSPANETLMAVLAPVLGAAAALLTAARLLVARRTASKFASLPRDALVDRKAHFFVDAEELEVLMRSVKPASMDREQDDAEEDGDPLKLALRDTQLARGAFNAVGHSHALHFDNACSTNALAVSQGFLMGNVSGARLTLAKGEAKASFAERIHALQIDAALTEIKGALGGDNLDLTSYVELQRRISAAIKTHRETLEAIRDVWRLGLRSRVGLASIHKMLKRAHLREKLAETQYKALLQAYPTNSQILSAYSQFLRGVRGNISGGAKYLQEAGKHVTAVAKRGVRGSEEKGEGIIPRIVGEKDAVIVMDQDGIMTVVNRAAAQLFGYTEHEMMDSNVAMLMPQSMAAMHASYVRTGVLSQVTQSGASDSKKIREVLALTKERHGLSINIAVTKHVHGKRAQFMAVVAPRPPPTHWDGAPQMTLWVSTSGSIIAASKALCHSLGYSSTEVMNLHASSIMDGDGLDMLLSSLGRAEESTGMRAYEVEVFPKGENEVVTYLAEAFMSGEKAPVVAIFFKRAWNIAAKVVFGVGTGIIEWASPSALELLGYDGTDLAGRSILDLMPPSVSCIHRAAWTSGASSELVDTFAPCMFARPVRMLRADGTAVVVKLDLNLETISDGSPSAVASDDRSWGDAHGSTESPQQRAPALEVTLRECTAGEEDRESTMAVVVDSFTGEILSLVDSMAFGLPEDVVQRKGPGARRFSISALVRMNGRAATLTRTWAQHGAPPTGCMVLSGTGTFVPAFLSAKPASGTAKLTVFLTRADLVRAVATVTRGSQVDMIDVSPPCLSVEDEGDMALRLYDVLPWLSPAARLSDVVRRAVAERPGGPTAGDKVEGVCAVLPGFGTVPCAVQAFTRGASAEEGYVLIVLQPAVFPPLGESAGKQSGIMEAPKGAETEASGPKGAGRGGRESHKTSANVRSAHEGRSEVREGEGGLGRRSVSSIEMLRRGWVSQTGEDETGDKQGTGPQNNGGLDDGDDRSRRQVEGGSKRGVEQGSREDVHERVVDRKVPALDGTAGTRSGEAGQTKESETAGGERLTDNGDDDTRHKRGNGIGWVDAAASGRIVLGDGALQEAAGDLGNAKSVAERQKKMSQFALHQEGGVLQEGHEGQETKEEEDWEHPDVDGVICKAMTAACSDGSGEGASEKHMEPMSFGNVWMHSWVATDGKPEKSHLFPASVGLSAQEPLTAESLTQLEISWRAAMMPAVSMEDFSVPAGPSAHPAPEGQEIKVKTEVEDVNESVQRQKAAGETRSAGGGSEVRQSSRDREHDSDSSAFLQAVLMASKRGSVVQMLPAATPGWGRAKRAVRKVTSRFSDMKAPERGESLLMRLATPPRRLSTNDVGAHGADTPRGSGGVMGAGAMGEGTVAGGEEVVLVQDSTEERAGRLNRIHTLLTAKSLQRPFRSLRRLLLVASIVIFLAHAAGFSAIIGLASRQGMLSGELKFAGSQKRLCAEAVLFAGIIQASGMGLEAPYISVDEARVQLAKIAADLKSNAEDLLAAVDSLSGSSRRTLDDLWTRDTFETVIVPQTGAEALTQRRPFFDSMALFANSALTISAAEPPKTADSFEMSFLRLNTESAFIPRLREIELAMQDYTVVNLRRIGAIAISFMVLEAFVIVPVLAFLLLRRISGIMVLRVSLLSVFLAVPRPIAAELAAQTVALAEFDDFETSIGETPPMGEQEGARGEHKGGRKDKAEGGGGGAEWHKVQQLMRTQIPRRKVRIARARLGADTVMENGGLRRRLFDGLPVLPLLLWAVLVVAIEAVTWQLQASESQLQGPKFALTTLTHHAMALPEFSLELALAEASGEPTETLYTKREHLKQAVSAVEAAQEALLYGSSDLLGKRIDSGVLWRVKALQALHFDEGCLRTDGDCPSMEEDGDRWLARRGMYMLVVGLADEAERLAEDPVGAVTLHNERLRLLIELGVRELRYGCQESERLVSEELDRMGDVVALQVALCVITGLLALCLPTCMAQPLLSRHRMEMWRMSQVLSALPEEMGVERVLVEELSREEEDKGEDLIEQLIRAKGTPAA